MRSVLKNVSAGGLCLLQILVDVYSYFNETNMRKGRCRMMMPVDAVNHKARPTTYN